MNFVDVPVLTEFLNDWLLRCTELVDKYHPQLFWFDQWIERDGFQPYLKTFAAEGLKTIGLMKGDIKEAVYPMQCFFNVDSGKCSG